MIRPKLGHHTIRAHHERGKTMGRNNRTTVKSRRRAQRPKQDHEQILLTLYATERLLCGCWSSSPVHTCGMAPPRYCTCGATTGEGCACPSPIGRAS